jgi:hypothetical protein
MLASRFAAPNSEKVPAKWDFRERLPFRPGSALRLRACPALPVQPGGAEGQPSMGVFSAEGCTRRQQAAPLLADIRAIFAERRTVRLPSAELVEALVAIEGRPWAEWKAGKAITANGLARLLAPFAIKPGTIRTGGATPKGYQLAQFEDAFARYLPGEEY